MTTVVIDVEMIDTDGAKLITARSGDQVIQSELLPDEITSVNNLAYWLLAQRGTDRITDASLQKRLTIDYHVEQSAEPDPETGLLYDVMVVDSVASEPLPADDGRANFASMPGWATWTASEAEAWITANVTDLASAKTALQAIAKAIVYLRNVAID